MSKKIKIRGWNFFNLKNEELSFNKFDSSSSTENFNVPINNFAFNQPVKVKIH